MILTCPACATSYFTPDEAIGVEGRRVRCQGCGEVWRASLDAPLELTATETTPDPAPEAAEGAKVEAETDAEAAPSLAETPAPELPRAFRARAEHQRRMRRAAAHGVAWAGLASLFAGLVGAAWLFRVEVVDMAPRAAAAYALVGIPVNPTGLDFEAVRARTAPRDPGRVVVSGAIRNVRDHEIVAPPVRVALLDADGQEIAHQVARIDAAPVLPGGVQGFAVLINDPGGRAQGVGVDFVAETRVRRAAEASPVAPRAADRAPGRAPPPAAEALRPALDPAVEPAIALPPSDARPARALEAAPQAESVSAPLRPALDSRPAEAVSAGNG